MSDTLVLIVSLLLFPIALLAATMLAAGVVFVLAAIATDEWRL